MATASSAPGTTKPSARSGGASVSLASAHASSGAGSGPHRKARPQRSPGPPGTPAARQDRARQPAAPRLIGPDAGVLERQQPGQPLLAEERLGRVDQLHDRAAAEHVEVAGKGMIARTEALARDGQLLPGVVEAREPPLVEPERRRRPVLGVEHARVNDDEDHEDEREHAEGRRPPRRRNAPRRAPDHDEGQRGDDEPQGADGASARLEPCDLASTSLLSLLVGLAGVHARLVTTPGLALTPRESCDARGARSAQPGQVAGPPRWPAPSW